MRSPSLVGVLDAREFLACIALGLAGEPGTSFVHSVFPLVASRQRRVRDFPSCAPVCRRTLPSTMMGELTPLPGIAVFQRGFFGSIGGSSPSATPLPFGPRKRDQSEAGELESARAERPRARRWRVIGNSNGWEFRAGFKGLSQTG